MIEQLKKQIRRKKQYLKIMPFYEGFTGTVTQVKFRCGKKNCACYNGKKLHGPYTVLLYRQDGRTKTRYIKKGEEEEYIRKSKANARYLKEEKVIKELEEKLAKEEERAKRNKEKKEKTRK